MRRLARHRRVGLKLGLGATCAISLIVSASENPARAQLAPFAVTSTLPRWLAPGGQLTLRGTADPAETVTLLVGGTRRTTTAGADGAFLFKARAPARGGLYTIALEVARAPLERIEVGSLRVRGLLLAAAGDVNLGDRVGTAVSTYGTRYPWLSVAPVLRSADIAITNLECSVSRRGSAVPDKQYTFRGSPASLRAMAGYAGVDAVTVANNHALDFGRLAFADTLRYAHLYGMKTLGGGRNLGAARRPAVFLRGGLRVAILGYSDVRPLGFDAGSATSGTTPAFPSYISSDVRGARARGADLVVVYFHWGVERTFRPTARERSLAQVAFDAGAKVVLGAHPHVLQPIERTGRHRLVAWSLGNFVFGANSAGTQSTGILRIRIGRSGVLSHNFRRARIGGTYGVQPRLL